MMHFWHTCIFGLREIKEYSESAECSTCFQSFSASVYAAIAQHLLLLLLLCNSVVLCVEHASYSLKGEGKRKWNGEYVL